MLPLVLTALARGFGTGSPEKPVWPAPGNQSWMAFRRIKKLDYKIASRARTKLQAGKRPGIEAAWLNTGREYNINPEAVKRDQREPLE